MQRNGQCQSKTCNIKRRTPRTHTDTQSCFKSLCAVLCVVCAARCVPCVLVCHVLCSVLCVLCPASVACCFVSCVQCLASCVPCSVPCFLCTTSNALCSVWMSCVIVHLTRMTHLVLSEYCIFSVKHNRNVKGLEIFYVWYHFHRFENSWQTIRSRSVFSRHWMLLRSTLNSFGSVSKFKS